MKLRKCNTCKEKKEIGNFYKDKTLKSGYRGQCKKCTRESIEDSSCTEKVKYKKCSMCKVKKKAEEFYPDITKKNGLKSNCKECEIDKNKEPEKRFAYSKKAAKKRNLSFEIDYEDYFSFIKKKCFYCNNKTYKVESGCGLDRIDNGKGYSKDNVLPACGRCNKFRSDFVPAPYFKKMMELYLKLQKQDLGIVAPRKKKKKKTKKQELDAKTIKKATQLSKRYTAMKKKWYKTKFMKGIKPNTKDFDHLITAVAIINRHEVKIKTFMEAQLSGLSFVNDGQGIFPKVGQLSNDGAETRLLEYLKNQTLEVELTELEQRTELNSNRKYAKYYKKFKDKTASLVEALYLKACQEARRGETQNSVDEYIKKLRKKV